MKRTRPTYPLCTPETYRWRCAYGQPAFVIAFEGDPICLDCLRERRKRQVKT